MSSSSLVARPGGRSRLQVPGPGGLLVGLLVGFPVGLALAALGVRLGPVAVVGLPAAGLLVAVALRRPAWAAAAVIATLPLSRVDLAGTAVPQLGAVTAVGLVVGLRLLRGERLLVVPPFGRFLVVLWTGALLAAVLGIDPGTSMTQVVQLAVGVLLVAAVATVTTRSDDRALVVGLLLAVAGPVCASALAGFTSARAAYGGTLVEGRSQGVFAQPNELGTFAAMVLLLVVGWLVVGVPRWRLPVGLAGLAAAGALVTSLSRGAWIGFAMGIVAIVVLRPTSRRAVAGGMLAVVVALAVGFSLAPTIPQLEVVRVRLESFADPTGNPYDERPAIYREGLRQVRARPLTGFGPAAFSVEASRQLESGGQVAPLHAHNTLLAIATETGLVTAGLVVVFTVLCASTARRRMRGLRAAAARGSPDLLAEAVLLGSAAALAVLVGQGLVDFSLRNPTVLVLVFLLLGVFTSSLRRTASEAVPA